MILDSWTIISKYCNFCWITTLFDTHFVTRQLSKIKDEFKVIISTLLLITYIVNIYFYIYCLHLLFTSSVYIYWLHLLFTSIVYIYVLHLCFTYIVYIYCSNLNVLQGYSKELKCQCSTDQASSYLHLRMEYFVRNAGQEVSFFTFLQTLFITILQFILL